MLLPAATRVTSSAKFDVASTSKVSMFAVPSMNKSWNSFELDPRSLDPSSSGKMSPPASKLPPIVVIPAIETAPLFCMVTPVPTVSLVVTNAVSSTSNTSIWAVPSMSKS